MAQTIRRLLCSLVAGTAFIAFAAPAQEDTTPPDVLVKNVTQEVVSLIAKDKEIKSGNRTKLIGLIEEKVLPHFDFQSMTQLAMGQQWRKANADEKARLVQEFKTLLVRTYASALAAYSDQRFDFRPLRAKPTDTDVTVNVRVLQPGAQPVTIDYSMEKTPSGWKAYDVMVGGVSLVANYRTEFATTVRDSGIEGLIKSLQTKNRTLETPAAEGAKSQ